MLQQFDISTYRFVRSRYVSRRAVGLLFTSFDKSAGLFARISSSLLTYVAHLTTHTCGRPLLLRLLSCVQASFDICTGKLCCSVLQCVAVCCSVLQCLLSCVQASFDICTGKLCCSVLQCVVVCCSVFCHVYRPLLTYVQVSYLWPNKI